MTQENYRIYARENEVFNIRLPRYMCMYPNSDKTLGYAVFSVAVPLSCKIQFMLLRIIH